MRDKAGQKKLHNETYSTVDLGALAAAWSLKFKDVCVHLAPFKAEQSATARKPHLTRTQGQRILQEPFLTPTT